MPSRPDMLGFIRYEGREDEVVAVDVDDRGVVLDAEEKTVDREEEEGAARCPFPAAVALSRSEPADGRIV